MKSDFDVIIAGGGISGLITAREVSQSGHNVIVIEEDREVGIPEKCGGLISQKTLQFLNVFPSKRIIKNEIKKVLIHSPFCSKMEINISKKGIIVLNRREFDRELAKLAIKNGSIIEVDNKVLQIDLKNEIVNVKTKCDEKTAKLLVDARGFFSLKKFNFSNFLKAAQFDVFGSWFEKDRIEIYLDNQFTPGYFIWVIPLDDYTARLGVAGRAINPLKCLDIFLKNHKSKIIKKIISPIFVGGAFDNFIQDRIIFVGDAAGQTKPTTGGGILTGGAGGFFAGQAISKSLTLNDLSILKDYQIKWQKMFGKEFKIMRYARIIYEKLENKNIERIFKYFSSSNNFSKILEESDFDFHSFSIFKILNIIKNNPILGLELLKIGSTQLSDFLKLEI